MKTISKTPKPNITGGFGAEDQQTQGERTLDACVAKRLKEIPKNAQKTYLRAVSGSSRKAAIKAFCLECVCWQREEVRLCTARTCPLYSYRPYQNQDAGINP